MPRNVEYRKRNPPHKNAPKMQDGSAKKIGRLVFAPDELPQKETVIGKGGKRNVPPPADKKAVNDTAKAAAGRKAERRLYFENGPKQKAVKENTAKPAKRLPVQAADAARIYAREKMYGSSDGNAGADAARAGEDAAAGTVSAALRRSDGVRKKRTIRKTSPYRKNAETRGRGAEAAHVCRDERGSAAGSGTLGYGAARSGGKGAPRIAAKRRTRRSYTASAGRGGIRQAGKTAKAAGGKALRTFSGAAKHPAVFGAIAAILLLSAVIFAAFSSCADMGMSGLANIAASSYLAENADIDDAELIYTEWETDLLIQARDAENSHPGYDEYRYNIGDVSHSPYALMGYLTAKHDDFTFAEISGGLRGIFDAQYTLAHTGKTETRYRAEQRTNAAGETYTVRVPYEHKILVTVLSAKPFTDIILPLMDRDEYERYAVLLQTKGNRQITDSPLDMNWLPHVTSGYGYRVHPVSGAKNCHKGVDIGVAAGGKVHAAHDGVISTANDADGYGRYITLTGGDGLVTRYAHLSVFRKENGAAVKEGDVIADTGNTGNSTGPHLHFEIMKDGRYLNPLYFAVTNDDGSPPPGTGGGRGIPEYPGEPMEDGTFAALMAEAQKHLGKPYVFGASGPDSFDCSGFVCYVFRHSGVKNIGRTTAQGLYNMSTPVSAGNVKPGDLVFFSGTYSTANTVTHVGIYIGNGQMVNAGDPVRYADLSLPYWKNHHYAYGRL